MKRTFLLCALLVATVIAVQIAHAAAEAPAVGTAAPDFNLTTNEGNQAALKDFKGKWVVLYFYPRDATPGCTLEAHNFQMRGAWLFWPGVLPLNTVYKASLY